MTSETITCSGAESEFVRKKHIQREDAKTLSLGVFVSALKMVCCKGPKAEVVEKQRLKSPLKARA